MNEQVIKPKRNLKPFWILLAVSGLPYILSWFYYANIDKLPEIKASNRGTLIEPLRAVEGLSLQLVSGNVLETNTLKGNWVLLTAGSSECLEECQRNIYHIRQIRRLMGEERKRISRVFVLLDKHKQQVFTDNIKEYGEIAVVDSGAADAAKLLEQMTVDGASPEDRVFIMDPLSNLIMVYEKGADPMDIAKDFRRLLKVSRIGQPIEKNAG